MKLLFYIVLLFLFSGVTKNSAQGKFSGLMFGDYFYNIERDSGIDTLKNTALTGKKDLNGFQFRRIYFTYDYKISDDFDSRFRIEADQTTANNKIIVFIKDAFLKWKNIFKGSDLIFGIQPTPAFEVSESVWGYRSLEKTILDLRGIVSSRDIALSLKGVLSEKLVYYWIMIGNNSGVSPEIDKYKRFYGHIQVNLSEFVYLTLYGDLKVRPDLKVGNENTSLSNNDITSALFIGYKNKTFSIGSEGFIQARENGMKKQLGSASEYSSLNTLGLSFFGSYNFSGSFGLMSRFDFFDPNIDNTFKGDSRNYYLLGARFNPVETVSIMPNIIIETYESDSAMDYDPSVTVRLTFYYQFQ
jgi:hypothetical protein